MAEKVKSKQYQNLPVEIDGCDFAANFPRIDELCQQINHGELIRAREKPEYRYIDEDDRALIVSNAIQEGIQIEKAARNPNRWQLPDGLRQRSVVIVDFSAPGTYKQPKKEDQYNRFPWALNMDRYRADASTCLGIHFAGQITGQDLSAFTHVQILDGFNSTVEKLREPAKRAIQDANMHFLYLGNEEESSAIEKVVNSKSSFVPQDRITIINESITNTVSQVTALKTYLQKNIKTAENPYGHIPSDAAIILPMGLQAVRTLPILEKAHAIPDSMSLAIFPIATPVSGIQEYASMEVKGRMFYTLIGQADTNNAQHLLLGGRNKPTQNTGYTPLYFH